MATTLHHTGFVVRDLERSIRFYTDGLGLNVDKNLDIDGEGLSQVVGYEKTHLKAALLTGDDGHTLELIQYMNPEGTPRQQDQQYERRLIGATHLAFIVDDVNATYERLISMGGQKMNPPAQVRPELKATYFQDPDGNWIELVQDDIHAGGRFRVQQVTYQSERM